MSLFIVIGDDMKALKWIGGFVLAIALIVGVAFGVPTLRLQVRLQMMRMFGTELESVKTDIYRENKSYVEGTVRDLRELQVDYTKADDSQRESLASLILHRANELDWDRLPSDVRQFLNELKEKQ
jgi:uncharacterized membrane-anchored protein YhcB (DUF1043 family)